LLAVFCFLEALPLNHAFWLALSHWVVNHAQPLQKAYNFLTQTEVQANGRLDQPRLLAKNQAPKGPGQKNRGSRLKVQTDELNHWPAWKRVASLRPMQPRRAGHFLCQKRLLAIQNVILSDERAWAMKDPKRGNQILLDAWAQCDLRKFTWFFLSFSSFLFLYLKIVVVDKQGLFLFITFFY
jgi:hypothetical protein